MKFRLSAYWCEMQDMLFYCILFPLVGSLVIMLVFDQTHVVHMPMHSTLETMGGIASLVILAFIHLGKTALQLKRSELIWMSAALISMAMLDISHALVINEGNAFIWLSSLAIFLGGGMYACLWLPEKYARDTLPYAVILLMILIIGGSLYDPQQIPAMIKDGSFTIYAGALNLVGATGFAAGGLYFLRRHKMQECRYSHLLAGQCLLFSMSALVYSISSLWGAAWWWSHFLRLAAYMVLLMLVLESMRAFKRNQALDPNSLLFPFIMFMAVCMLSMLPILMHLFGFDFGIAYTAMPAAVMQRSSLEIMSALHTAEIFNLIMELSAFVIAFLTALLAFSYFVTRGNVIALVIGMALACAGVMDVFYVLVTTGVVDVTDHSHNYVYFAWVFSRGFCAAIFIIGAMFTLLLGLRNAKYTYMPVLGVCVAVFSLALASAYYIAHAGTMPQAFLTGNFVVNAYELVLLVLFFMAIPVYGALYRKHPNFLVAVVMISFVPQIVLEAHMALGSMRLYDAHFNIAHLLKLLAYGILFFGLLLEHARLHRIDHRLRRDLRRREKTLELLFNGTDNGIVLIDSSGIILEFNNACEALFGYDKSEVIGKNVNILMPDPHSAEHDEYIAQYLQYGKKKVLDTSRIVEGRYRNGSIFPLELRVSEIKSFDKRMFLGNIRIPDDLDG